MRVCRRGEEAEDLLQQVLLAAVEAGRSDLSCEANERWIKGALRQQAAFQARCAIRRRRREELSALTTQLLRDSAVWGESDESHPGLPVAFLSGLTPSLRTTALLALTGHSRREIAWLLGVTPAALRQRIAELRRRWHRSGGGIFRDFCGLRGTLDYGRMRAALAIAGQRVGDSDLGSHDPDGHLLILSSRFRERRQPGDTTN